MDAYVSLTSTHSGKMTALQRQVQMKITILVTWVRLLCFSSQQSASERLHNKMSYIQLKCLERVEQTDGHVMDEVGVGLMEGGKSESRQIKSTGFPNTLVPCQPAQMTDTACLFLASSFS